MWLKQKGAQRSVVKAAAELIDWSLFAQGERLAVVLLQDFFLPYLVYIFKKNY